MLKTTCPSVRGLLAFTAGLIQIFNPPSLWFQQNVYGFDTSAIMPYTIFCLLLFINLYYAANRAVIAALFLVALYGSLMNWSFSIVTGIAFLYCFVAWWRGRTSGMLRACVAIILGSGMALSLYMWQLVTLKAFPILIEHARWRMDPQLVSRAMGMSTAQCLKINFALFWRNLWWWGIFISLFPLLLIAPRVREVCGKALISAYVFAIVVILAPGLVDIIMLRHHAAIHNFSVLKFSFPFAVLSTLFFAWLMVVMQRTWGVSIAMVCLVGLLCLGVALVFPQWLRIYKNLTSNASDTDMRKGLVVHGTLKQDEVGVSPDFELEDNPPQAIAYCLRCVHKVKNFDDIKQLSAATGCRKMRVYFYKRTPAELRKAKKDFRLIAVPRHGRQIPEYASARVDPFYL